MRRLVLLVVLAFAAPAYAESEQPGSSTMTENPDAKLEWKGPSGFWTNPRPAKGGAYRWRMMAIGGVVLAVTVFMVIRLVKNSRK